MTPLLVLALLVQDPVVDMGRADAALDSGKYDRAIELYTKVLSQDPSRVECLVGRSRAKLGLKDYDGAIEDATAAITAGVQSEHVFVFRAMARQGKGDLPAAILDLRRAIVANPKNVNTYLLKAAYREAAGDLEGAIEDCSDAIGISGRRADLWAERAGLRRKKKDFAGAVSDYSKAIELEPRNPEHFYWRGLAFSDDHSPDLAIQDLHKALELDPKHFMAAYTLGGLCADRKDRSGALEWYSRALELEPDSAATLANRAGVEIPLGKLDQALADVDRAIRVNPKELAAFYRRSTILTAKGKWSEAKAAYEQMLKLGPEDWSGRPVATAMLAVLPALTTGTSPDSISKRLADQARGLIAKKSYGDAIILLEEAIQLDLKNKAAFELLVQAHDERNDNSLGDRISVLNRFDDVVAFGQGVSPQMRKILLNRSSLVLGGLLWLARHQSADGRWSSDAFGEACGKDGSPRCEGKGRSGDDLRSTSLVILAFLGAAYSQLSKDDYGDGPLGKKIAAGLAWLLRHQNADGSFGDPKSDRFLQDHAVATMALSEAYGMTAAQEYQGPAQKAAAFLISARIPGKGWPKGKAEAGADGETTGWALLALTSATMSEIAGAQKELKDALESARSTILGGKPLEGVLGELQVMAAMACLRMPGKELEPRLDQLVPAAGDPMRLYFGTLAIRWGGGESRWKSWKDRLKPLLVTSAPAVGDNLCVAGSWDPDPKEGRLMTTALHALTLELYYGYRNAFGTVEEPK